MAIKISYTDLKYRKIGNRDLSLILVVGLLHHHLYQYRFALIALVIGLAFSKYIGAGDVKYIALVILLKENSLDLLKALEVIAVGALGTALIYLSRSKSLKVRAPLAPSISLGLLL